MFFATSTLHKEMAKTLTVTCNVCKTEFQKAATEVRRSEKLGRRHYCSRRCCGLDNVANVGDSRKTDHLRSYTKLDELSPFRYHMRRIVDHSNQRGKPEHVAVTLEDLRAQWEEQKGVCPYTGWQLVMTPNSGRSIPLTPDRASVDRIDSSLGYTKDNIQFIAFQAQVAKHCFTGKELLEFCKAVANLQR